MTDEPSLAIRLFGTDEPVAPPRLLRAGPLSAELEAGNLRYIRYRGAEVLRAVSYIVRDKDWGTYNPEISDLEIAEGPESFTVSYGARTADEAQAYAYRARIEGRSDGTLIFHATGAAESDFLTNRTGFVILHPIAGIAGSPVTITHTDGRIEEGSFPRLIDPVQPMMDLRMLAHVSPQGHRVTCLMEGDAYEMEDQRNWTDASYKTYVRPLARPWPYILRAAEAVEQRITVSVEGGESGASEGAAVRVAVGAAAGRVPALGIGLDPDDAAAALELSGPLKELRPAHLICHHDPRRGHDGESLRQQLSVALMMEAEPWLEAIIETVEGFEAEIAALGQVVAALGQPFRSVLLSPAPDLKCTLPGSVWPPAPDAAAIADAARRAFPGARICGGMISYFTEFNRKRPPVGSLDLASFTTSAMVHAGDDRSVIETLQALPDIARSAAEIARPLPFAVGPSAIGMRANPYGAEPKDNPLNIRQAMNFNDPRQRGLLGAAWTLGYFANFALGGAEAIALDAPVGAFGAVHAPAAFPQPWYDENGGVYPLYHPLRGLARLRGRPLRLLEISDPDRVTGIAVDGEDGGEIWLANLTGRALPLRLPEGVTGVATLDAESFRQAASRGDFMDALVSPAGAEAELGPYALMRLRGSF
ncbi:MAG TPA: hypothetical protein VNQ78_13145 [Paracoccus sp. (in: a-proteobacteria)]|uniref:hypothetical protein n=1 Tax=Paracoccus sp. TaxID=267 RepID=UPI002BAF4D35|nr:hypothetical protein [Paracoccus sp. (in: a-proteobacteria)]HWL57600.1 hypothetical protein [Paracoccus sp. (in: a-proteobacteria)]